MNRATRWNDKVILDILQKIGETQGRIMGIEAVVKEIHEDVKEILKSVALIPDLRRMLVEHLKEDEPTELYVNRNMASWVKKGMWAAATGLAGWFVAKVTGR
ncbi:MAG: hypothetical protein LBJ36_05415 [Synergistaceae bacterium]|jgi:hypothetical protein|nr:hypothetical protein [Synergistaceae bacterium]